MRILIADDSKLIRERLAMLIEEIPDVEVINQVEDTPLAIKSIKEFMPEIVILDLRMPGGGGLSALTQIKKEEPPPKVIVLTNYSYPQLRKKCMEEGADFFLDKSNEFEKVIEIIKDLIKQSLDISKSELVNNA